MIIGLLRVFDKMYTLLVYYVACGGNSLSMFWNELLVSHLYRELCGLWLIPNIIIIFVLKYCIFNALFTVWINKDLLHVCFVK